MTDGPPISKVYYRPIEAAIRWVGLLKFKKEILSIISTPINIPQKNRFLPSLGRPSPLHRTHLRCDIQ